MSTSLASSTVEKLQGKYRVLAQLGQGGTANVMLAVARGPSGFNKLVVLKSMRGNFQTEPEIAAMFLGEARLAARLNHPNVVQTNEVFESPEGPVIVMEYLEGQSLSHLMARARGKDVFPLRMHLRVICESLAGLHHAHELADFDGRPLNVVHRDMSPHNIFVTFDGQVKVLDFGIAKLSGTQIETATGVIKGKLRYMAPEQITGEGVDRRTDIFAMGIMLWEAATGERMWRDMTDVTIMNRILNDELPPVGELKGEVPASLVPIIEKCLKSDPDERYATAEELLHDLEECVSSMEGTAVRQRDIGAVVAKLFDDSRKQMRAVIEEQLAKVASLSNAEYEQAEVIELTAFGTHSGLTAATQIEPVKRSLVPVLFGAVLALALVGVAFAFMKPADEKTGPGRTSVPSPEPAPVSNKVAVRITAFPATSKLYLDGVMLPSNPYARQFDRDEKKQLSIEVRADGHKSETRIVPLDQDTDVVVTLTAEAKPTTEPSPKPTATTRPGRPKPTQAKPTVSCDPPFVIDERGLKRYKPECL